MRAFTSLLLFPLLLGSSQAVATPPTISPGWGDWQATGDTSDPNIYVWNNVRFADEPPRFGKAQSPQGQNPASTKAACIQVNLKGTNHPRLHLPRDGIDQGEDCLGLDIYAPTNIFGDDGRLTNSSQLLPVVVWIFGGGYVAGSKNLEDPTQPLYTGQSLLRATNYNAIFVAGNYRLGAFGWLAGNYMESLTEGNTAQTNAGLYDQALLLDFVSKYISQVGGDPNRVSVWGESAGASSILHHLVREEGTVQPAFQSFLVQSPAFEWSWDNSAGGTMDQVYQTFSQLANCNSTFDITCLQQADIAVVTTANQNLFDQFWNNSHKFPVGPSVDSVWVKTIPALSLTTSNKYWPTIKGAVISHTGNEAKIFTPSTPNGEQDVKNFLTSFFPESSLSTIRDQILTQYTPPNNITCRLYPIPCWQEALQNIIRDSSFTCNTRFLLQAYGPTTPTFMMSYLHPYAIDAFHALDLIPLYMNSFSDAYNMIHTHATTLNSSVVSLLASAISSNVMPTYQAYMGSFAVHGDPNAEKLSEAPSWSAATTAAPTVTPVMEVANMILSKGWHLDSDDQNTEGNCGFWLSVASVVVGSMPTSAAAAARVEGEEIDGEREDL
ncbi:Alpha/Beta hydrolase protein [Lasiosphaeris hirsuta]|uniref:Alpha/Beta hydrolase protein n=1 Tax=Lasiosphaeris hirsuta TaxID=260670 RepID=A0AA39ZVT2_9PEZI|nr:Alpha/Beta hydrolase protein [Lasiosphaeris hirsuta]